jgi:hypothetical protein
MDRSSLVIYL